MAAQAEVVKAPKPHTRGLYPWGRYWAKFIDMYAIGFLIGRTFPDMYRWLAAQGGTYGPLVVLVIAYPSVEAAMICALGTTPGKALFGISVLREDGSRLGFAQAIRRSYGAMFHGAWMWIPLLSLIALQRSYSAYVTDRVTVWDLRADARFVATRPRWYAWVGLALVVTFYAYMTTLTGA